ncbi:MAG: hypothetical protein IH840_14605 [Candidatus Heimdallarchaeota archaeon]|nr:hypothetical protein [Candidatus Heimdallarchaeota archaeon]
MPNELQISILKELRGTSKITVKELLQSHPETDPSDLKYSLRRLRETGIVKHIPDLGDMRRVFYRIATAQEFAEAQNLLSQGRHLQYSQLLSIFDGSI